MLDADALKKAQFLFGVDAWILYTDASMKRPYVVGYEKVHVDDGKITKKSIWMGTGTNWEEALDAGRDQILADMQGRLLALEWEQYRRTGRGYAVRF